MTDFTRWSSAPARFSTLEALSLSETRIDDAGLAALAVSGSVCTLRALSLAHCRAITNACLAHLQVIRSEALGDDLDISFNPLVWDPNS